MPRFHPNAIQDEFTRLNISRQLKQQRRRIRDKLCVNCGAPVVEGYVRCAAHMKEDLSRHRKLKRERMATVD